MKKLIVTVLAVMATAAGIMLAADAKAGGEVFNKVCKGCHGDGGATPNEAVSKMLGAPIPKLADAAFQKTKTDADIKTAITAGKGKMPKAAAVKPEQVDDVIAYVRSLAK